MKLHDFDSQNQLVPIETAKVVKTDAEWQAQLTTEQFQIARGKGTEQPFCGNLLDNKRQGWYACVCCNLPLFASNSKFNSGTGWPSFFQPIAKENVTTSVDSNHGMMRTEILCAAATATLAMFSTTAQPQRDYASASTRSRWYFMKKLKSNGIKEPRTE